jgi:Na+/H+ antiporter NhaD/arsenite permease-like protein
MWIFLASAALGHEVPLWLLLPFAGLLLAIALCPLLVPDWWHHHYPKVSITLGAGVFLYYYFGLQRPEALVHVLHEYFQFISLIGSLFVVASGIHINVKGESRPWINVIFLAMGAVLANLIGTTGASMLLIRPWIRMNKFRITSFHIVMFIFIISNVAGALTPIGDPPLFLGYLVGVPFWWTLQHAWPAWLIAVGSLLAIFYVFDVRNFRKPPREVALKMTASEEWRFEGVHNLIFLAVILGAVLANSSLPLLMPEAIMIGAAVLSYWTTRSTIHQANAFTFAPIKEVMWLFAGIFATMIPALDYLGMHAADLGISTPLQFYFASGFLSAFLDNAPTYLTFLSADIGLHHGAIAQRADVLAVVEQFPREVLAISLGAVFFGAFTYIGNGPNLMVKSIADHAKVHMPSFFGYIFRFSIPVLLPVLLLIALLLFSPWAVF